ncbi:voltage-gated chloride channel [Thermoproteus uzoniensis 768-20]|uniref:Voltage-gated chloride channel n=1 Tax=Thermoproteus uzoniensis (strain 768-20) TaxID=999630 RepID=F2L4C0_THEU7|nr:chloride channel protein [Thermoproteus uzoniensis]AEA13352.1 voltage-gated chloride channel [Thermoproteus uzoniensis 768-20]
MARPVAYLDGARYLARWLVLGLLVGVVSGLAALAFYYVLKLFEGIFLVSLVGSSASGVWPSASRYYLLPASAALGGALASLVIYSLAPEAEGSGTDFVIRAYHELQGRIRWIVAPVKIVATALTIGSGGSGGAEGPAAQYSASLSSFISDILKLSPEDRKVMVAVGMGAGIGAIFKAPIGGALLAAEALRRGGFETRVVYPALVASAASYAVFGGFTGYMPLLGLYAGSLRPIDFAVYAALGLVAGLAAIAYVEALSLARRAFGAMRARYVRPIAGMAIAGSIALLAPQVVGEGFAWVRLAEAGEFGKFYSPVLPTVALLALLPVLKILATAATVGSGGSGGLFAPAIFIGAFIGVDMWFLIHYMAPHASLQITPLVVVGIAAMLAAATKTPLSAMAMAVEMIGGVQLLPAVMVAVAVSYVVSWNYAIFNAPADSAGDGGRRPQPDSPGAALAQDLRPATGSLRRAAHPTL